MICSYFTNCWIQKYYLQRPIEKILNHMKSVQKTKGMPDHLFFLNFWHFDTLKNNQSIWNKFMHRYMLFFWEIILNGKVSFLFWCQQSKDLFYDLIGYWITASSLAHGLEGYLCWPIRTKYVNKSTYVPMYNIHASCSLKSTYNYSIGSKSKTEPSVSWVLYKPTKY